MHLSLEEKCSLINRKWALKISRTHLSNIYRAQGVKRMRPSFKFTLGKRTEAEYNSNIRHYVNQLIYEMRKGKKIIYCDETSSHLWEKLLKVWMKPEDPLMMRFKTGRGKSITITGGICHTWPQSVFLQS
jgi:hypothetical protein